MAVCQNLVPLVNIQIAGKWMFIPLKMVLIGIDPYPYQYMFSHGFPTAPCVKDQWLPGLAFQVPFRWSMCLEIVSPNSMVDWFPPLKKKAIWGFLYRSALVSDTPISTLHWLNHHLLVKSHENPIPDAYPIKIPLRSHFQTHPHSSI